MLTLLLSAALAFDGTPIDGYPTPAERELHLWSNAVRVAPADFDGQFAGCRLSSFQANERTPKPALAMHHGLNEAARAHTQDMVDEDFFSHTGSNGSTAADRMFPLYPGNIIGENIAGGQATPYDAVMGWMCSPGHRSNIMEPSFDDLGVGVIDRLYTQSFGGGAGASRPVVVVGAHSPFAPSGTVSLLAIVDDAQPVDAVDVWLDGAPIALSLQAGTDQRGLWGADTSADGACHRYAFVATRSDGSTARYPASGDYGFGPCEWDDATAQWLVGEGDPLGGGPDGEAAVPCGCQTRPGSGVAWLALGLVGLIARRRR